MARYYFHLIGRSRWEDEEGEEFPDLKAACRCAIDRADAIGRDGPNVSAGGLSIQVTVENGATIFAVSVGQPSPLSAPSAGFWLH